MSGPTILNSANKVELLAPLKRDDILTVGHKQILQLLAVGAPLDEVLAELMRFIEAQEDGLRCGILIVTDDGSHFRRGRGANLPEAYHKVLDGVPITPPYYGPCGEAAHLDKVVVVPDIAADTRFSEDWRRLVLSCGLASMRSSPVRGSDGRVLACLDMYYDHPRDPNPNEPGLIEIAANLAAIALERSRSETALAKYAEQQALLHQFTDRLYRAQSPAEKYDASLDAILAALSCNRASILLFDRTEMMRFVAARGLSLAYQQAVEGHSPWKLGQKDPQPICIEDSCTAKELESLKGALEAEGIRGLAFIPLVGNGGVIGKFMTYYETPHCFTPHEIELALTIARQLGFSLERSRADEMRRREDALQRAHQQELAHSEQRLAAELMATKHLQAISAELIHEGSSELLYGKIIDAAILIMRSEYASMQMFYPERGDAGELRLLAFRGFNAEATKFWEWVRPNSESTCGLALRSRKRVIVPDVKKCDFMSGTDDLATYLQTGIHAVQTTPLLSRSGGLLGMISTHWENPHQPAEGDLQRLDVLSRQAADAIERAQSERRLNESEEQLRLALRAADVGLWDVDPINNKLFWDARVKAMFGIPSEAAVSMVDFYAGLYPADSERTSAAFADASNPDRRALYDVEYRTVGKEDGVIRWVAAKGRGVFDEDGACIRVIGTAIEITARKQIEQRQKLLLNELNHRVKNTLATVQSIAMQTLRSSEDTVQAREQLDARLVALSKAHDILTQTSWEGASLRQLINQAVVPYCIPELSRFQIEGPEVWISARSSLALAMALHELCTNAVKYGALSNNKGRIRVGWTVRDIHGTDNLQMHWIEEGGPQVTPPKRRGFGSRLIERGLSQDLDGEVRIEFRRAGVICKISAPLGHPGDAGDFRNELQ